MVKPSPAIAAVDFNSSITNKGKIDDLRPNKIQLFIKASANAIWYGFKRIAWPKVVCPNLLVGASTFLPNLFSLRKNNAIAPAIAKVVE